MASGSGNDDLSLQPSRLPRAPLSPDFLTSGTPGIPPTPRLPVLPGTVAGTCAQISTAPSTHSAVLSFRPSGSALQSFSPSALSLPPSALPTRDPIVLLSCGLPPITARPRSQFQLPPGPLPPRRQREPRRPPLPHQSLLARSLLPMPIRFGHSVLQPFSPCTPPPPNRVRTDHFTPCQIRPLLRLQFRLPIPNLQSFSLWRRPALQPLIRKSMPLPLCCALRLSPSCRRKILPPPLPHPLPPGKNQGGGGTAENNNVLNVDGKHVAKSIHRFWHCRC